MTGTPELSGYMIKGGGEGRARPDTTQSMPRIFQAWGRKPAGPV